MIAATLPAGQRLGNFGRVVKIDVIADVKVSTISFLGGWETMVIGGALDGQCERYPTEQAAIAGHDVWAERVRA